MGGEFGQRREWAHDDSLQWHLLQSPSHSGLQQCDSNFNRFYRSQPTLYQVDFDPVGFEWIDCNDVEHSVVSFLHRARAADDSVLVVCNFTSVAYFNYRVGVPGPPGFWNELFNSDAKEYGGGGQGNMGGAEAVPIHLHGRPYSLTLKLPPLATVFFKHMEA
jgi:1,4-alpha-glucan branching enzyme